MVRILIVAGGTGGHIVPAIAFGEWARKSGRASAVTFVCGSRPLEREIYAHHDIFPRILPVEGSPLGTRNAVRFLRRSADMVHAWRISRKILREETPDGVFLFGGYVSLPFVLGCREKRVPLALHEQNARAGKVTRIARRLGAPVAAGWPVCSPLPQGSYKVSGIPTRTFGNLQPEVAWNKLNLGRDFPSGPVVLVLGGSLGSSRITRSIISLAGKKHFQNFTFLIPGGADKPRWTETNVCLLPRVWDPEPLFVLADIAVTRAGGSTLAELECMSIPALVVPWPLASDDHQRINADMFVRKGLGVIWEETERETAMEAKLIELEQNRDRFRDRHNTGPRIESINADIWSMVIESK